MFLFTIVERVEEVEMLIEREQVWIDSYDFNDLYNICPIADSQLGREVSEETIQKHIASKQDVSKAVNQICLETGNVIRQFSSVRDVTRELGYCRKAIGHTAKGWRIRYGKKKECKTAYGYGWEYA